MKCCGGNCTPAGLEQPPRTDSLCHLLLSHRQQTWKRSSLLGPSPLFSDGTGASEDIAEVQPACATRAPEAPAAGCGYWGGSSVPWAQPEAAAPQHPKSDHNKMRQCSALKTETRSPLLRDVPDAGRHPDWAPCWSWYRAWPVFRAYLWTRLQHEYVLL